MNSTSSGGQVGAYHTSFALNPAAGYGVIVLMTGPYPDSQDFTMRAVRHFQPVFDDLLEQSSKDLYAGHWGVVEKEGDAPGEAVVRIQEGTLLVEKLVLNGTDTLGLLQRTSETTPTPLWSTGRKDEFR